MINNLLTSEDYKRQGYWFLNIAWDNVFDVLIDYENYVEYSRSSLNHDYSQYLDCEISQQDTAFIEFCKKASSDVDYLETVKHEYMYDSQKKISLALALSQQGAELILKSKIAEVSPYLLIAAQPKDWPKRCDKNDIEFTEFRTIDAHDLIRVFNTVCPERLPENFVIEFNSFRQKRNSVFHSVNVCQDTSEAVISYILNIANICDIETLWTIIRQEYLEDSSGAKAINVEQFSDRLCCEMQIMIDILDNNKLIKYFDFDKKKRKYVCPNCYGGLNYKEKLPMTAQLKPNNSKSTTLFCFVLFVITP